MFQKILRNAVDSIRGVDGGSLGSGKIQIPAESEWKRVSFWEIAQSCNDSSEKSVSVFRVRRGSRQYDAALAAAKRLITIRHPNTLRCDECTERDDYLYLVTEPVIPVSDATPRDFSLYSMYEVCKAAQFLLSSNSDAMISVNCLWLTSYGSIKVGILDDDTSMHSSPLQPNSFGELIDIARLFLSSESADARWCESIVADLGYRSAKLSRTPSARGCSEELESFIQLTLMRPESHVSRIAPLMTEISIMTPDTVRELVDPLPDSIGVSIPPCVIAGPIFNALCEAIEKLPQHQVLAATTFLLCAERLGSFYRADRVSDFTVSRLIGRCFKLGDRGIRFRSLMVLDAALRLVLSPKDLLTAILSDFVNGFLDGSELIRRATVVAVRKYVSCGAERHERLIAGVFKACVEDPDEFVRVLAFETLYEMYVSQEAPSRESSGMGQSLTSDPKKGGSSSTGGTTGAGSGGLLGFGRSKASISDSRVCEVVLVGLKDAAPGVRYHSLRLLDALLQNRMEAIQAHMELFSNRMMPLVAIRVSDKYVPISTLATQLLDRMTKYICAESIKGGVAVLPEVTICPPQVTGAQSTQPPVTNAQQIPHQVAGLQTSSVPTGAPYDRGMSQSVNQTRGLNSTDPSPWVNGPARIAAPQTIPLQTTSSQHAQGNSVQGHAHRISGPVVGPTIAPYTGPVDLLSDFSAPKPLMPIVQNRPHARPSAAPSSKEVSDDFWNDLTK